MALIILGSNFNFVQLAIVIPMAIEYVAKGNHHASPHLFDYRCVISSRQERSYARESITNIMMFGTNLYLGPRMMGDAKHRCNWVYKKQSYYIGHFLP